MNKLNKFISNINAENVVFKNQFIYFDLHPIYNKECWVKKIMIDGIQYDAVYPYYNDMDPVYFTDDDILEIHLVEKETLIPWNIQELIKALEENKYANFIEYNILENNNQTILIIDVYNEYIGVCWWDLEKHAYAIDDDCVTSYFGCLKYWINEILTRIHDTMESFIQKKRLLISLVFQYFLLCNETQQWIRKDILHDIPKSDLIMLLKEMSMDQIYQSINILDIWCRNKIGSPLPLGDIQIYFEKSLQNKKESTIVETQHNILEILFYTEQMNELKLPEISIQLNILTDDIIIKYQTTICGDTLIHFNLTEFDNIFNKPSDLFDSDFNLYNYDTQIQIFQFLKTISEFV